MGRAALAYLQLLLLQPAVDSAKQQIVPPFEKLAPSFSLFVP